MRLGKIRRRLSRMTELPEASFGMCPYVAIEGNSSVRIDACLEILSYEEGEVRLRLRGMTATIRGEDLTMRCYGERSIRIGGRIAGIDLDDGKKE